MAKKPVTLAEMDKPAAGTPAPAAPVKKRIEPELTGVSNKVEMPERVSKRGSKSKYPFDALTEKGMSFGIKNKTAANMGSVVSGQNRKHKELVTDADGNPVFETQELKGADGSVTEVPTDKQKVEIQRHFFAMDVDPKKDPDGASVRIFRDV